MILAGFRVGRPAHDGRRGDGAGAEAARLLRAARARRSGTGSAASPSTSSRRRCRRSSRSWRASSASTVRSARRARSRTASTPASRSAPATGRARRPRSASSPSERGSTSPPRPRTRTATPTCRSSRPSATPSSSTRTGGSRRSAAERGWPVREFSELALPGRAPAAAGARRDPARARGGRGRLGRRGGVQPDEALSASRRSASAADDVETLFDHFDDAERRGKLGHGHARIEWLETQELDPAARPVKAASYPGFDFWESRGALGYLVLAAICAELAEAEPWPVRVVAADAFPTGHLGYWVRWLAEAGLVARADRLLAGAAAPPGRRRAARRHDPARDRAPEPGGRADRRRRLDGRRHLRRRAPRRRPAGGARPVRRRAGAQGVRARGRPRGTRSRRSSATSTGSCSWPRSRSSTTSPGSCAERAAGLRLPGDS